MSEYLFYTDAFKEEAKDFNKRYTGFRTIDDESLKEYSWYRLQRQSAKDIRYLEKTFPGLNLDRYCSFGDHNNEFYLGSVLYSFATHTVIKFTQPMFVPETKQVSYFESMDKKERDIRTTCKLGKFIKKITPLEDDKIEAIVNIILDHFKPLNVTHKFGDTREDFKKVYTARPVSSRNIGDYACINASCMRGDTFHTEGNHPCEVYASGDFEIHYLENEDGKIAARAILYRGDESISPIYACSIREGNLLFEKIKEMYPDVKDWNGSNWYGAKLLKIVFNGYVLAPYIDEFQEIKDHGDSLEIVSSGYDYVFHTTSGYLEEKEETAKCCGCSYAEPVSSMNVIDSEYYCSDCSSYCDYNNEHTTEDTVKVHTENFLPEHWAESAAEKHAVYCEKDNKYYEKEYYAELYPETNEEEE